MLGKRRRYEHLVDTPDASAKAQDDAPVRFEVLAVDKPPKKSIVLGILLLFLGLTFFFVCYLHHRGHTREHIKDGSGWGLAVLGFLTFLPGAYTSWLAYGAWRGFPGYRYSDIPTVE